MKNKSGQIDRPTPETKWYVTEYPDECSFAITDGNEIFATIIGGNTIGDQCDLASRIAKLPDLERERDEAREALRTLAEHGEKEIQRVTKERDEARAALRVIADCQNWFHTDKEEGGPYTAWRGDGQPDEIAEKALEEAK